MATGPNTNLYLSDVCCHLPFKYWGVTYHDCTKTNHDQFWCATDVDADGNYIKGKWQNCDKNCKSYFVLIFAEYQLFRNKRFMLDEKFQQNASKLTIFLGYKNPCIFFHFSFHAILFFSLWSC